MKRPGHRMMLALLVPATLLASACGDDDGPEATPTSAETVTVAATADGETPPANRPVEQSAPNTSTPTPTATAVPPTPTPVPALAADDPLTVALRDFKRRDGCRVQPAGKP